jgi:predicted dehydrogenase
MAEKVRVGVIGTSGYADMMHLPTLHSHSQARIVALCGRNRDRAGELAAKYDIPQVFSDYRAMLDTAGLDAVVVATPDDLHYAMTMDALEAGLHVVCEKPLALNAAHAREMAAKAEENGVKHMTVFTYRWLPGYRYARELVAQGYLGRPFHCHISYFGGGGRGGQYRWRFDGGRSNGVLGDLGSHMIDLARCFLGDITRVCGQLNTFVQRSGADGTPLEPANDAAQVMLQFANGAQGSIQLSQVAHLGERGQEQRVTLHGEGGALEVDFTWASGCTLRGARHDEEQLRELAVPQRLWGDVDPDLPFGERFSQLLCQGSIGPRLFIDAIVADRPLSPSFHDGLKAQEVVDAAIASHERGAWITVA